MCLCVRGAKGKEDSVRKAANCLSSSWEDEVGFWTHINWAFLFSLSFFTLTNHTRALVNPISASSSSCSLFLKVPFSTLSFFQNIISYLHISFPTQHTILPSFSLPIPLWSFVFPYLLHVFLKTFFLHQHWTSLRTNKHTWFSAFFLFLQGRTTVQKNYRDTKSNPINGKRDDCSSILTNILKYTCTDILILADTTSW